MAIQNGHKANGSHLVEVTKSTDRAWWKEATVYQGQLLSEDHLPG